MPLRKGQQAFNVLSEMHPALADKIRGTDLDPFYDDTRLQAFFAFVAQHWKDDDTDDKPR